MRQTFIMAILCALFSTGCEQIFDSVSDDKLEEKTCELKINKVIHQVWHAFSDDRPNPPAKYQAFAEEWKKNHPDWTYMYWTKEKSDAFMKTYYPDFYPIFKAYPKEIQRADAIRYFALDHFGGVYADFDSQNLRNVTPLLCGFDAVFGEQPTFYHSIANGFMASVAGHPLWKVVVKELEESKDLKRAKKPWLSLQRPEVYSAGPEMLTRAIHKYLAGPNPKTPIKVFGPKYFFPVRPEEAGTKGKICRDSSDACRELFPEAFCVEHWSNSW